VPCTREVCDDDIGVVVTFAWASSKVAKRDIYSAIVILSIILFCAKWYIYLDKFLEDGTLLKTVIL
jgi:hypothetical protein